MTNTITRLHSLHTVASLDEEMGGSVRAPLMLADALVSAGHCATVVGTYQAGDAIEYLQREFPQVECKVFRRTTPKHHFRSPNLRKWLMRHARDYDIVDVHGLFSFVPVYSTWTSTRSGVPYVLHPHGSLEPFDLKKHAHLKRFYNPLILRPMLNHSSGMILTTELERTRMRRFGRDEPTTYVVPLPVQVASAGEGKRFRRAFSIPESAPLVLFLGRLDAKKGLQFLIPAVATLRNEFPDIRLAVVGTGDRIAEEFVDQLVKEASAAAWTVRCGFLSGEEKAAALAAAEVFALPSLNENFGIAVVEALQAGAPVVISDEVYIHDVLHRSGAAVVCRPNIESCRDAIRSVLADARLASGLRTAGPRVAHELFSTSAVARNLASVYRTAIDQAKGERASPKLAES